LSEPPEKKHSWAKFHPEPGASRPPMAEAPRRPVPAKPSPQAFAALAPTRPSPAKPVVRAPQPTAPGGPPKVLPPPGQAANSPRREATTVVSDELAAALNKLAKEYAAPAVTDAPFVTALQREEEAKDRQREARLQLGKMAGVALVALVALHFTITRVVYRVPSPAALEAHVASLSAELLSHYSSARQPLQAGNVNYLLTDRINAHRIRYAASATLQLRKPLYVPASTNGTAAYRQLQESLQSARGRSLKFSLYAPGEGPQPPELPLLLQMAHRPGESVIVRVPFEAKRFGWSWRIEPAQIPLRVANRTLVGDSIERYEDAPYLIFGAPGSMAEVRRLIRQARAFIVGVTTSVQKQADFEAVVEPPPSPIADPAAGDPDAATKRPLTLEELTRLFDPNAPAIELPPQANPAPVAPGVSVPVP